jgi:hypothetical protein
MHKCRDCDLEFSDYNAQRRHRYRVHRTKPKEKVVPKGYFSNILASIVNEPYCAFCRIDFANVPNARRHFREKHDRRPLLVCTDCGKSYIRIERHACDQKDQRESS